MTLSNDDLVLGVDGGGSKTVAWIARCHTDNEPVIVGRGASGGSNPQAVGMQAALENLAKAVDLARNGAASACGPLAAAVVGLAGSDRHEVREPIVRWAEQSQVARCFRVEHDALPVLAAGSPEGWGVALVSGTGSLAFGQDREGRTARAGGWGFLLGDEGSGYAIARAGLRAAARAADGRGPATRLLEGFVARLGCRQASDLVGTIHRMVGDPGAIAALAPVVLGVAEAADDVARAIVAQAGNDLATMVTAVAQRLGFGEHAFPLAYTGGVLLANPGLCHALEAGLAEHQSQPTSLVAVREPVAGAVQLAVRLAARSRQR